MWIMVQAGANGVEVLTAFEDLCSEGILVPSELNLFLGEVAWASRMGFPDPLAAAIAHARMGVHQASAADVAAAARKMKQLGVTKR